MKNSIRTLLRGVGQVMLQNNALTGLLFLAGIFYNSWIFGVGALLGNVISTIFALVFKNSKQDIENGLYGFNGTLVGIAVWFFFGVSVTTTVALVLGAILSTVIMHEMKKRMPAFTAPFVLATWVVIFGLQFSNLASLTNSALPTATSLNVLSASGMGFGQVMLQGNIVTGALFLLAIIVSSRTAALYSLYGSLLGGAFALLLSLPIASINLGLFGYNAVLCGIALEGKKWSAFLFATFAILLSVFIQYGFGQIGIITLTAPFVVATWVALLLKK